jgi:hypothetical protein
LGHRTEIAPSPPNAIAEGGRGCDTAQDANRCQSTGRVGSDAPTAAPSGKPFRVTIARAGASPPTPPFKAAATGPHITCCRPLQNAGTTERGKSL